MLADDTFRPKLHAAIEALRSWSRSLADCASIEESEAADHWRLALTPHAAAACPVELILHADQRFDIAIGPETYEDQPVEDVTAFNALLGAITDGRVVNRAWSTPATGAHRETETLVDLGDTTWQRSRIEPRIAGVAPRDACVARTRHFAPYRAVI
jgi:hypothetical protein